MPSKYRKKPVVVEAMQYLGEESVGGIQDWIMNGGSSACVSYDPFDDEYYINIFIYSYVLNVGDYIVREPNGRFEHLECSVFGATYEKVEEVK